MFYATTTVTTSNSYTLVSDGFRFHFNGEIANRGTEDWYSNGIEDWYSEELEKFLTEFTSREGDSA